ncbi:hypothetical protein [Polyangium sp. 15x6]|nr:hypothetical protein [Polyangium sp. 15x6]
MRARSPPETNGSPRQPADAGKTRANTRVFPEISMMRRVHTMTRRRL